MYSRVYIYKIQQSDITSDEKVLYSADSLQDFVEIPARITSAISCEVVIYNICDIMNLSAQLNTHSHTTYMTRVTIDWSPKIKGL